MFELLGVVWVVAGPILLALMWRRMQEIELREESIRQEIARVRRELQAAAGANEPRRTAVASLPREQTAAGATSTAAEAEKARPLRPQPSPGSQAADIWLGDDPPVPDLAGRSAPQHAAMAGSAADQIAPAAARGATTPEKVEERSAALQHVQQLREKLTSTPSLEEILAGRWLTWVGALALIVGVGFFFRYSIEQGLIGETGRVALGILTGVLGFAGGCWLMHRDYRFLSQGLAAAAAGTLYFSLYFAAMQYQLVPVPLAFAGMVAVTAALLTFAGVFNTQPAAVLGLVGGFLTPLMLSSGGGHFLILFSYLLILDAGVLILATWRNWGGARVAAFLGTVLLWLGWLAGQYREADLLPTVFMMTVFFVLFAAMGVWHNLYRHRQPQRADYFLMLSTPIVYFSGLFLLTMEDYSQLHGLLAILMASVYGCLAVFARLTFPAGRSMVLAFGGVGALFATVAIPLQLTGHWITIAWAGEALLLVELGLRFHEADLRKAGFALLVIVQLVLAGYTVGTLDNPSRTVMNYPHVSGQVITAADAGSSWTRIFNGRSFSFLASAIVLGVLAWEYRRRGTGELDAGTNDGMELSAPATSDKWLFPPQAVGGVLLAALPLTVLVLLVLETIGLAAARRWLDITALSWSLMWMVLTAVVLILLSLRPGPRWLGVLGTLMFAGCGLLLLSLVSTTLNTWDRHFMLLLADGGGAGIWAVPLFNPRGLALLLMTGACTAAALLSRRLQPPERHSPISQAEQYYNRTSPAWMQQISWDALHPGNDMVTLVLGLAAVITGLVMFTIETWAQGAVLGWSGGMRALAVTLVWTVFGTVLLVGGIARRSKEVRVLALCVFVLTAAKVFLYDVWRVDAAIRTLAFVALGASLMLVSYLYRRHRERIRDFFVDSSADSSALPRE